jgi:uncharacterized membrane protein
VTTTAENVFGVTLTPDVAALSGAPGAVVQYTLTVQNTGNVEDIFEFSVSGNDWAVTFPDPVTLAAGTWADVTVSVTIPIDAADGVYDDARITATSVGYPAQSDISVLTTTTVVEGYLVYLPVIDSR